MGVLRFSGVVENGNKEGKSYRVINYFRRIGIFENCRRFKVMED